MKLFDTHSHYNDEQFENDVDNIIEETFKTAVDKIVCIGYSIETSKKAIEVGKKNENIYVAVGVSPQEDPQDVEKIENQVREIEEMSSYKKVVAIGEIGLDYHWKGYNKETQKLLFIKQIQLANKLNLPISIHSRDAWMDTIDILKNVQRCDKKGVFHCCQLNQELVKEALKLDYYISFAGPITFKNSKNAKEIVEMVPIDKIVIETDSPYLSPEPLRGRRNDSRNVEYIAKRIAEFKGLSYEEVADKTYNNAMKLYGIK